MKNLSLLPFTGNKADGLTLHDGVTNTAHPLDNLLDEDITKVWRSTDVPVMQIRADAGAAVSIDAIAVINHNLTSTGRFRFKAGLMADFSDVGSVLGVSYLELVVNYYETRVSYLLLPGAVDARYLEIEIRDTTNPDGYFAAGLILAGRMSEFPYQFVEPFTVERLKRQRVVPVEVGRPLVGATIFDSSGVTFDFAGLERHESQEIERHLQSLDLMRHPALVAPEGPDSEELFFGRLAELPSTGFSTASRQIRQVRFVTDGFGQVIS